MLHGGAVMLRVRHERVAAVVGNVEPLVSVGGPGIRELGAAEQVAQVGYGVTPEAHCAIDVHPCSGLLCQRDQLGKAIERAAVHIAGLKHHDGWLSGIACQRGAENVRPQLPRRPAWQHHDVGGADTEELGGPRSRAVHFG